MRWLLVGALLAACGGRAVPSTSSRGDAVRLICEAECRLSVRCQEPEPDCPARCAALPIPDPPVWRSDWGHAVASCIDHASCVHDADEGCVLQPAFHTRAAASCGLSTRCLVYDGLTPRADDATMACVATGKGFEECAPELYWK